MARKECMFDTSEFMQNAATESRFLTCKKEVRTTLKNGRKEINLCISLGTMASQEYYSTVWALFYSSPHEVFLSPKHWELSPLICDKEPGGRMWKGQKAWPSMTKHKARKYVPKSQRTPFPLSLVVCLRYYLPPTPLKLKFTLELLPWYPKINKCLQSEILDPTKQFFLLSLESHSHILREIININ